MKVQKVVRVGGEYAKVNQDFKDGDKLLITDEGQIVSGDYGDRHVFKVETKNGEKNLSLNQTSMNNLIDALGDDTSKWKGQEIRAWVVRQSVSGQLKNVCYLTAVDWGMVEDDKGNLKFEKLQGKAKVAHKVMNKTEEMSDEEEDDIPY